MIEGQGAPWWAAGGLFALWLAREAWGAIKSRRRDRTETDANVDLIEALRAGLDRQGARITAMEEAHSRMALRLEEEIHARQSAQEEAHRLRLRVMALEAALRGMGAVIPPDHTRGEVV